MKPFPSPELRWVKAGWEAEYVSGLGPSYVLHVRGTKRTAGALVERARRIVDGKHILWGVERELNTPGDYEGKGLAPKKGPDGKPVRLAVEWVQPFHEAVKRLQPPVQDEARLSPEQRRDFRHMRHRHYWLKQWLSWRGLPCPCNHLDIIHHLASQAQVTEATIKGGIERAGREVVRLIGVSRVPDAPGIALPRQLEYRSSDARVGGRSGVLVRGAKGRAPGRRVNAEQAPRSR